MVIVSLERSPTAHIDDFRPTSILHNSVVYDTGQEIIITVRANEQEQQIVPLYVDCCIYNVNNYNK